MHWTTEFYRKVDAGDPDIALMVAPDIAATVGKHPQTHGIEDMMKGELGRHAAVSRTSVHRFIDIWDLDENQAALNSLVAFNRVDGRDVTIPVLTIIRRNNDNLNDRLQLFLDNAPLFDGTAA